MTTHLTRRAALGRSAGTLAAFSGLAPLLAACGGGGSDSNTSGSLPGWVGQGTVTTQSLTARSNGTTYPIYIYLPANVAKLSVKDRAAMTVVYSLDGDYRFPDLARQADAQGMPIILVGIGNDAMRGRDYVPLNSCTPGGGGQAAYFDFIRLEVVPFIESTIGGDPTRRALWGHSHGGTFVYYAMFAESATAHTFRTYLPEDSSISCMPDTANAWESAYAAANSAFPGRVYISYSANDNLPYVARIQNRHYTGLTLGAALYAGGHIGMIPASFTDSIAFALAGS